MPEHGNTRRHHGEIAVFAFWIASFLLLALVAPPFDSVVREGEFAFLPPDSPTLEVQESCALNVLDEYA